MIGSAAMERNHVRSSVMVPLALMILVVTFLPETTGEIPELGVVVSRHLLAANARKLEIKPRPADDPMNADCETKFQYLNYTPVTSACKSNEPTTRECCAAFNRFACQFRSQVNDFNTICPILFMSYLNYAGRYPDGYFIDQCVDGTKGLCA
ncbi:hypothetical protein M758_12G126200 [Ceratodon purpureus]|nr:hypothetical protein M758_12G126200 [Ceratodon purpureus]